MLRKFCVLSKCRPLCWLGDQLAIMPFTRKERKVGRPAHKETSCSKDFYFLIHLLDHIHGVVAIVGMPLRFRPHDHGRLALDETPYPAFDI